MKTDADFTFRVHGLVRRIPYGRVASYGDVASLLGVPRAARGVGQALRSLPRETDVPWWRVVNARGEIALHAHDGQLQRLMLEHEGVRFSSGRIRLREHRWEPETLARQRRGSDHPAAE